MQVAWWAIFTSTIFHLNKLKTTFLVQIYGHVRIWIWIWTCLTRKIMRSDTLRENKEVYASFKCKCIDYEQFLVFGEVPRKICEDKWLFYTVKKTCIYLLLIRALLVLYFVQLDNNKKYRHDFEASSVRLMTILDKLTHKILPAPLFHFKR